MVLARLKETRRISYVAGYDIALIYVTVGEKDQALEWL
jgi:hypothetical protein